ncbi:DUF2637 domain-containing protein [Kitasatospora cinereorecta]|uniref:DUF2637 domain-containing protein n=1 Tax=Kitasatospora cinereorecta TaxID=285560 RepID=A0ABW0VPF2_9ACTN
MSTTATAPNFAHVTGWDRAVVIALGAAGCALSYDALQQMAAAIHVRGFLTYLLPLVIDGFIAYGVRALLVMRDAALRSRAYVWLLFGAATAASLWANALHAVRLNEQTAATGLRLGDTVVAVLSTIAPLALAGAVHLYILIARGPITPASWDNRVDRENGADLGQLAAQDGRRDRPEALTAQAHSGDRAGGQPVSPSGTVLPVTLPLAAGPLAGAPAAAPAHPSKRSSVSLAKAADLGGHLVGARPITDQLSGNTPVTAAAVSSPAAARRPVSTPPIADLVNLMPGERRTDLDTEELLEIARRAVKQEDKLTRKVVAQAIRGQQIPLSSDTLTQLMTQLRAQHGQSVIADRN